MPTLRFAPDGAPECPVSMQGKTCLVTGATSGIGLEASVSLARAGATLVIVGRDPRKIEATLEEIRRRAPGADVRAERCDVASQAQIRALSERLHASLSHLDVLVNNAGAAFPERQVTDEGLERTLATNHVGYFLLTTLVLDLLEKAPAGRIVSVSSEGHRQGTIDLGDMGFERGGYHSLKSYCRSKLGNNLMTLELSRRLSGTNMTANCLHPGVVATNIWSSQQWWVRGLTALSAMFMKTSGQGAETIVYLAASPEVARTSGQYFIDCKQVHAARLAQDVDLARKLWEYSEKVVRSA